MPANKTLDGEPTAAELNTWKTWFINNHQPDDVSRSDWVEEVNEVFGEDVNERSRSQIIPVSVICLLFFAKRE